MKTISPQDNRHETKRNLRLRNGLITRHAYSVTGLARVRGQLGDTHLVRLRNPWGKGEWNGPWSERSWEWDSLSERDKELLSARVRNEGEFWMAFDDFAKQVSCGGQSKGAQRPGKCHKIEDLKHPNAVF